jgi:hypothetical protein
MHLFIPFFVESERTLLSSDDQTPPSHHTPCHHRYHRHNCTTAAATTTIELPRLYPHQVQKLDFGLLFPMVI